MNESTSIETATGPANPKRKRRAATPRSPRNIDPGIAAIHAEAAAKVKEYRKTQGSARVLKTILGKRLSQMTQEDKNKLFAALKECATPTLV